MCAAMRVCVCAIIADIWLRDRRRRDIVRMFVHKIIASSGLFVFISAPLERSIEEKKTKQIKLKILNKYFVAASDGKCK